MGIERAVVKGTIASLVQTRSVYTCSIVTSGGDTSQVLWNAYLLAFQVALNNLISNVYASYSYELFIPVAGSWVSYDEVPFVAAGSVSGDYLPNAVTAVLLGKAPGLRHVGRKFVGPIPESLATANVIVGAGIVAAAAALLAYITPFTGIGGGVITPGIVDQQGNFHAFVGGTVSSILGSCRRRKPGLGI